MKEFRNIALIYVTSHIALIDLISRKWANRIGTEIVPRIHGIAMTSEINSYVSLFSLINPRQINGVNSKYIYNCF